MSNENKVRRAHRLLDYVSQGRAVLDDELKLLRSFLPEPPKQKTLEEILEEVESAACSVTDSCWSPSLNPQDWLWELHAQLKGLKGVSAVSPALPAGMRLADHVNFGRVVVSPGVGIDRCHEIFYLDPGMSSGTDISEVEPDSLTFIDAEPAHPEFLETEADYKEAPKGTVVAEIGRLAFVKEGDDDWTCGGGVNSDPMMALGERSRVLRWGWGE